MSREVCVHNIPIDHGSRCVSCYQEAGDAHEFCNDRIAALERELETMVRRFDAVRQDRDRLEGELTVATNLAVERGQDFQKLQQENERLKGELAERDDTLASMTGDVLLADRRVSRLREALVRIAIDPRKHLRSSVIAREALAAAEPSDE